MRALVNIRSESCIPPFALYFNFNLDGGKEFSLSSHIISITNTSQGWQGKGKREYAELKNVKKKYGLKDDKMKYARWSLDSVLVFPFSHRQI